MKQVAFVVEYISDGEKTFFSLRLTNGQALACTDSFAGLHEKIDSFLEEFEQNAPNKE